MPPLRTWFRRLALACMAGALALAAAELTTRVHLFGASAFSLEAMAGVRPLGDAGVLAPSPHAEVRYQLAADVEVSFKCATLRTNSLGLRDGELELSKPEGSLRVAVLGDSFTMGSGVELEDCYHSRLEVLADTAHPERRHEFVNFGVGGYGMLHYAALVEHEPERFEADLVLIGFCATNDQLVTAAPRPDAPPFVPRPARSGWARSYLVELTKRAWWKWNQADAKPSSADGWSQEEVQHVEQHMQRVAAWRERTGTPVIVALLALEPLDPEPLRSICARSGIEFVNATAHFEAGAKRSHSISPIDAHPNAGAHALQAQALFEHLESAGHLTPHDD